MTPGRRAAAAAGRAASASGAPPRDWVPRLRVGDRTRSGDVTAVWEGCVAIPRAVFEQVGGWPAEFRFAHEGIDLAWRVMDIGLRVRLRRATSSCATRRTRPPRTATPPTTAPATACGSPAATSRSRWPSLYVAGFVLRTLPLLARSRSRTAGRGARLPGRIARAGGCRASRCA